MRLLDDLHLDPSLADPEHCLKKQFHLFRNGGGGEVPGRFAPGSLLADPVHCLKEQFHVSRNGGGGEVP